MIGRPRFRSVMFLLVTFLACLSTLAKAQMETRSQLATTTAPGSVVAADFNHDGKMDLAVAPSGVSFPEGIQVFLGKGDGTFNPPTAYDTSAGTGPIAVADLNHDGIADVLVVNGADNPSASSWAKAMEHSRIPSAIPHHQGPLTSRWGTSMEMVISILPSQPSMGPPAVT
jgi:hypothetical protein